MGAPTHDLTVGYLQAYQSPAGLQSFLLEQPSPDQVHLVRTWAPVSTKTSTTNPSLAHGTRTFKCNYRSSPCGV